MQLYCLVTMDVEVDKDTNYCVSNPPSFKNVTEVIPNILEPLYLKYEVKPTYLISSEVMQDDKSLQIFQSLQTKCELATHGHAELLGKGIDINKFRGIPMENFLNDYPYEEQFKKLSYLTNLFQNNFGFTPKSFRAGRFGVNCDTLNILSKLGYLVDSSITPGRYWYNSKQILNYLYAPEQPYQPSIQNILQNGKLAIVEAPVTSWVSNRMALALYSLMARLEAKGTLTPSYLKKIIFRAVGQMRWIRPTTGSSHFMVKQMEEYLNRHSNKKNLFINIMFHPIELVLYASPYSRTTDKINNIINNLKTLLNLMKQKQAIFITLQEIKEMGSFNVITTK